MVVWISSESSESLAFSSKEGSRTGKCWDYHRSLSCSLPTVSVIAAVSMESKSAFHSIRASIPSKEILGKSLRRERQDKLGDDLRVRHSQVGSQSTRYRKEDS